MMKQLKATCYLFLALLIPMLGIAQSKTLIISHRVFPKVDKVMEFEKALANHAQKYHSGDVSWRVFKIQSGPDAGGYQITEGPKTWDSEDARGDISPEHQADWNKNVTIYLTDRQSVTYSVYNDSLSTVALNDFAEKANITHVFPKVGQSDNVINMIKKLKKAWASVGMTVAVYNVNSSGPAQISIVTRYKQGLKERNPGFRKPFKQAFEEVNGEGSYAQYIKDLAEYIQETWAELIFLRQDLGSK